MVDLDQNICFLSAYDMLALDQKEEFLMSNNINTILYATDLGAHARPAFKMAVNLAKAHDAKLLFVYVVEPLTAAEMSSISVYFPDGALAELHKHSTEEVQAKVKERINSYCEEELDGADFPGGRPEVHVVEGVPAATIIKLADTENVDMIVMGSHSRSSVDKFLLGSVANKVVNRSNKPVLLVPIKGD